MTYFVTYLEVDKQTHERKEITKRFFTVELLFAWLQDYKNGGNGYLLNFSVCKGECIFDGS